MSTVSVRLRYRPFRIGWCVDSDDFESLTKAMKLSFTMWGGSFNPIIPVDRARLASALVREYRVDALYAVRDTATVRSFIEAHKDIPWPFHDRRLFAPSFGGGNQPRIVDITHPVRRIVHENYKDQLPPDPALMIYEWDENEPLADVLTAWLGRFPPASDTEIDYAADARLRLNGRSCRILPDHQLPPRHPAQATVAGLNRAYCQRHYSIRNNWNNPGFYLGSATDFLDLVHFWNLRATGVELQFHDPHHADRLTNWREAMLAHLPDIDASSPGSGPWGAIWHRRDRRIADEELPGPGNKLGRIGVDEILWNGLNLKAPVVYFGEDDALASLTRANERSSISFSLNQSPFVSDDQQGHQHFILSVEPVAGLTDDDSTTLFTPFIPGLNTFYGQNCDYRWDGARAEPDGIGLVRQVADRHITLRSLDVTSLISAIFATVGITAAPSKPGRVAATLIRQMGGLESCRPFKIAGVRALIENHRPEQSFDRATAAQTIMAKGTDHSIDRYESLHIEYRESGTKLTKDAVLEYLLKRDVFRAGLDFACPSCQLEFWLSLDDAKTHVECPYCGNAFNTMPQLHDKAWAFRRSGLFGRDDNQEGAIPVLLTLQQLMHMADRSDAIFATAMTLNPTGASIKPCETDFVIVSASSPDRKVDLVIGECKTRMPITDNDVANLVAVADCFPDKIFNVYIVFSKTTSFQPDEVERIKAANREHHSPRAIMLTDRELEPYFIYGETAKEFDIDPTVVSFEDLAKRTIDIFFKEKRRSS